MPLNNREDLAIALKVSWMLKTMAATQNQVFGNSIGPGRVWGGSHFLIDKFSLYSFQGKVFIQTAFKRTGGKKVINQACVI